MTTGKPPIVDQQAWRTALTTCGVGRRPPPGNWTRSRRHDDAYRWWSCRTTRSSAPTGPVRLADVFDGHGQLITYHHMWTDGAEWQCGGCTRFTSQFTRLDFLDNYDARFVIVTNGPIEEALAYRDKVGNRMDWYSSSDSSFGADVDAAPGEGFAVNVFPA